MYVISHTQDDAILLLCHSETSITFSSGTASENVIILNYFCVSLAQVLTSFFFWFTSWFSPTDSAVFTCRNCSFLMNQHQKERLDLKLEMHLWVLYYACVCVFRWPETAGLSEAVSSEEQLIRMSGTTGATVAIVNSRQRLEATGPTVLPRSVRAKRPSWRPSLSASFSLNLHSTQEQRDHETKYIFAGTGGSHQWHLICFYCHCHGRKESAAHWCRRRTSGLCKRTSALSWTLSFSLTARK